MFVQNSYPRFIFKSLIFSIHNSESFFNSVSLSNLSDLLASLLKRCLFFLHLLLFFSLEKHLLQICHRWYWDMFIRLSVIVLIEFAMCLYVLLSRITFINLNSSFFDHLKADRSELFLLSFWLMQRRKRLEREFSEKFFWIVELNLAFWRNWLGD